MAISNDLLNTLMKDYKNPEDLIRESGLLKQLTHKLLERAMQAEMHLAYFEDKWNASHPTIGKSWCRNWERITPLFSYPPDIRRVIYTTNDIESVNMSLRKVTKNRGSFSNDESMFKLLYLALKMSKKWTMPIRNWKSALNQFSIIFENKMPII